MSVPDFISYLPERVWYLTSNGQDMWCRRPYGFFFSSSEAAVSFAEAMKLEIPVWPIGIQSKHLVSSEGSNAIRRLEVTRLFLDPQIDGATGDVFGTILRLQAPS